MTEERAWRRPTPKKDQSHLLGVNPKTATEPEDDKAPDDKTTGESIQREECGEPPHGSSRPLQPARSDW